MKVAAIVAAAGKGERMKAKTHKAFVGLGKDPILSHTLRALEASNTIGEVIIVVHQSDLPKARLLVKKGKFGKVKDIVAGGKRRMDSVKNGLDALSEDADFVIVHDGCRPFVDNKMINSVIDAADTFGAAITALPVKPTIKQVERGNFVAATLDRSTLVEVQTPQAFRKDILLRAYDRAFTAVTGEPEEATDDAVLVERMGIKVKVVDGSADNIKITTPEDLKHAKALAGVK
ncbi:MAG: 2-C-methyl-D-erythritol 4-phosphate cytidylyltransferase [Candidatus Omnitrophota bacterium]